MGQFGTWNLGELQQLDRFLRRELRLKGHISKNMTNTRLYCSRKDGRLGLQSFRMQYLLELAVVYKYFDSTLDPQIRNRF